MERDDYYWYWLCNIKGIGNRKQHLLLSYFEDARAVYESGFKELKEINGLTNLDVLNITNSKKDNKISEAFCEMENKAVRFVHIKHKAYPNRLKQAFDPPVGLYVKGKLPKDNMPSVAIVGARACSAYGKEIAYSFSREFAKMGIQVISGMALGVDTYGHMGCLDGGGYTCAVLGSGADICYPRRNISLYSNIVKSGGVVSEYPIGTPPFSGNFPMRNRIISALSDVIVLVEARTKSGSLITVDQGLEQNKEIFVVPGRIGDALSEGCNELIKQGATLITNPEEILSVFSLQNATKCRKNLDDIAYFENNKIKNNSEYKINLLASQKNIVYSGLDLYPKSMDTIIEETGLNITVVSEVLLILQLEGRIKEVSKNSYIKCI